MMLHTVMCLKSCEQEDLIYKAIYKTTIPLTIIRELTLIEKRDWILFRDSPYPMFGHFIYHNLHRYPQLKNYITKESCHFEFIYEFITDQASLEAILCYAHGKRISLQNYKTSVHRKPYHERWLIVDAPTHHTLIFFDFDFLATSTSPNNYLNFS